MKRKFLYSLSIFVFIFIWLYWGNNSIQITNIEVREKALPQAFNGFKIVQVSDLHNAEFGENQSRLLKKIKKMSPDIIAVTGDLIDSNHTDIDKAMEFIKGAADIAPIYYVTGNHEAALKNYAEIEKMLRQEKVIILNDKTVRLEKNEEKIYILGLTDYNFYIRGEFKETRNYIIKQKLEELFLEADGYKILLSHRPELFKLYCEEEMNLVLSGHAHGGQIYAPVLGGLIAPNQGILPKYTQGVYKNKDTKMVVSRGMGNSIIPLRVNNRPELVLITLKR